MSAELSYLSLGWGVQSFALAAMMALGEIPRVDYLVHADTGHEREATYAFARQWTPWLGEHGLSVVTVHGTRTEVVETYKEASVMIPAFTIGASGSKGQVMRQCTTEWKIRPLRRFVRAELARRGIKLRPRLVDCHMGISIDEFARMRDSDVAFITNVYPLVDLRISRAECAGWLESKGLPVPAKSACTFCPYHGVGSWKGLKRAGGEDWREAVAVDEAIREKRPGFDLYVHPYRKPLAEAVRIPEDDGNAQLTLDMPPEQPCDSGVCFT